MRAQTPQTSSGGSYWTAELAQMSCLSTSQPISCWQRETVCFHQRWTWAPWSKTGRLVSTIHWNSRWVANATTAEMVPTRTKQCRVEGGRPAAPTEPGKLTQTGKKSERSFKMLYSRGPLCFSQVLAVSPQAELSPVWMCTGSGHSGPECSDSIKPQVYCWLR